MTIQSLTEPLIEPTIEPIIEPPVVEEIHPRRFTVTSPEDEKPTPDSHRVRSEYVEECWLTYLGPNALLFARKCDAILANDNKQAVEVHKVADQLGIQPTDVLLACHRLVRFGLATWSDRDPTLYLLRHWPTVPAAIATKAHRKVLMALPDQAPE